MVAWWPAIIRLSSRTSKPFLTNSGGAGRTIWVGYPTCSCQGSRHPHHQSHNAGGRQGGRCHRQQCRPGWASFFFSMLFDFLRSPLPALAALIESLKAVAARLLILILLSLAVAGDLSDDDPLEAELRAEEESTRMQHSNHRRPTPLSK